MQTLLLVMLLRNEMKALVMNIRSGSLLLLHRLLSQSIQRLRLQSSLSAEPVL